MRIITLLILITISLSLAREQDVAAQQRALDSIRLDVEALKRVRLEKTNQLEKADAIRYQNRSIQNQAHLEYQNETRILEGNYSRVSDNISRMATELGSLRNLATEQKERAGTSKNSLDNFYLQVKQAVDKSIEEIPQDFPAKKEERLLNFASNPPTIETFFNDRFDRLALTQTQELSVKNSYRLRLGTVFFADAAWGQSNDVQAVFRTGSLTGKIFDWHNTFSKELSTDIRRTVFNAQQGADIAWVPIDILQTKSVLGASMGEDIARSERLVQWFKAGGIVMYPLILVALAALFMALERFFVFWKRGHISKTFTNKLYALVKNNQIAEARQLCKKQKTSLGKILGSIVENSDKGKEQTLKTLQEILLAEQAGFDKRMSFLAALGTIAPLLGLLGTVTGMITLFQVITQAGTNDARLLAGGISEALITTETGLIIAIPVMLIHGKLSETLNFITTEIRIQSLTLLNIFWKDE
ncbi:MAG: MotA/TolQ/ExbB proton channel family protein [Fibromonadaceae bacterium]|jgi:biopolymer transport protein ExbB|nr:MotA/TolQ/ExbB proton channel family protein [Fibromonadaceae bacterium]